MIPTHYSVLKREVLEFLKPVKRKSVVVDGTLGEGGHTLRFLEANKSVRMIGIDADPVMLERARERVGKLAKRVKFVNNFFDVYLKDQNEAGVKFDRILLDLGISIFHLKNSGRGFSFRLDEPLDMRLNPESDTSAADIVNSYREDEIADILYLYGEERLSRRIASAICDRRKTEKFSLASDLADVIFLSFPAKMRHGRIHPATKSFQALRIAVNGELDRLKGALTDGCDTLAVGGRFGVISFHSLEDRIVKHMFRDLDKEHFKVLTKKPVVPLEDEVAENPPSRSAKLRVVEKIAD